MNFDQLLTAVQIGLIYGVVTIGVLLTFRIINFRDLTVDGSFPLGAAVTGALMLKGYHPILCTLAAFFAGSLCGFATGYLHLRWKVVELLSGILVMTAIYSINLRIMKKPNISYVGEQTIFDIFGHDLISLTLIVGLISICIIFFLRSQIGLAIRVVGVNPRIGRAYGVNVSSMIYLTLAFSNGLIGLGGSLFAQSQGFSDISMGIGTIIIGLASVILGEKVIRPKKIEGMIIACLVGSIVYRICISAALNIEYLGFHSSDINLITSAIVIIALLFPKIIQETRHSIKRRRT